VDTTDFDYSKVGAATVGPRIGRFASSGLSSSGTPSVASGQSSVSNSNNLYGENASSSDLLSPLDNEDQFVIYAPAGKLGLVVDNRDDGPPVIHSIKADSVLIEQIQVGDRLVGVDEVDVRTLSPVRVSKLISKRSTNPLRKLTLTRGKTDRMMMVDDMTVDDGQSTVTGREMSRMSGSGIDTDTNEDESALQSQGFSDDDTSFVGSMSRVSGDGHSMDSSLAR
jgi:PDZ domain